MYIIYTSMTSNAYILLIFLALVATCQAIPDYDQSPNRTYVSPVSDNDGEYLDGVCFLAATISIVLSER